MKWWWALCVAQGRPRRSPRHKRQPSCRWRWWSWAIPWPGYSAWDHIAHLVEWTTWKLRPSPHSCWRTRIPRVGSSEICHILHINQKAYNHYSSSISLIICSTRRQHVIAIDYTLLDTFHTKNVPTFCTFFCVFSFTFKMEQKIIEKLNGKRNSVWSLFWMEIWMNAVVRLWLTRL